VVVKNFGLSVELTSELPLLTARYTGFTCIRIRREQMTAAKKRASV
jgi:hypothetical protein